MTTFKFSPNSDSYDRCFTVEVDEKTLDSLRAGQAITVTVTGKVEEVEERRVRDYGDGPTPCCAPPSKTPPKFVTKRTVRITMTEVEFPGGKGTVQMGKKAGEYDDIMDE